MNAKIPVNELLNAKFSRFSSLLSVNKCSEITLREWSEEIKSEKHKTKIDEIRSSEKGPRRDSIKKTLPCVTLSGTCENGRGKGEKLTTHSGLMQLDFDEVGNIEKATETLMEDPFILMVCLSPSGEGVKAVAAIDPDKHKECFNEASKWYAQKGLKLDKSTKDPKRTFFASSDSDIWIKESGDVEVFRGEITETHSITTSEGSSTYEGVDDQYGSPIVFTRDRRPKAFNQNWFSQVMLLEGRYRWDKVRKVFFKYNDANGVWESADIAEIKTKAGELGLDLLRQEGWIIAAAQLSSESFRRSVVEDLKGRTATEFPTSMPDQLHVQNGMLSVENGNVILRNFNPSALSLHALPISYDPDARCPLFLDKLLGGLSSSEKLLIQKMTGCFLFGQNPAQKIFFVTGEAGSGKSCLLECLQYLVGHRGSTELRIEQLGERFETHRYIGKRFLYCDDARINLLQGKNSEVLKKLTGGTLIDVERKNSTEELYVRGDFPILFTSNTSLALKLNGDVDAWRRRILIVSFKAGSQQKIPNFAQKLFDQEGSGILNWALDGWALLQKDLLNSGQFEITPVQQKMIDDLLMESESLSVFVKNSIIEDTSNFLTSEELVGQYESYCESMGWIPNNKTKVRREVPTIIAKQFRKDKIRKNNKQGWDGLSVSS
jgi:P4 family phage/plasmid primase-like protien